MAAVVAELSRTRDQLITAQNLITECLRVMTREQYDELRRNVGSLDELGGFRHEPPG